MRKLLLIMFIIGYFNVPLYADEIDDKLISAIIQVESRGNTNAVSPCGAIGLMQITPVVLKEYNEKSDRDKSVFYNLEECQMGDPELNKIVGTWYLNRLKNHYLKDHYTIERLLAAYNGGYSRLKKVEFNVNRMPKETRDYVRKVMRIYKKLQAESL